MPRLKIHTERPARYFITIEVDADVKTKFETIRKEKGFKRTSDYGRKLIKEDIRRFQAQ